VSSVGEALLFSRSNLIFLCIASETLGHFPNQVIPRTDHDRARRAADFYRDAWILFANIFRCRTLSY
jgi:hypothetical protein